MADDFTARFRVDISDLKANLTSARKEIKQANAEFKASTAGMDSWKKDADGLAAKLKQLDTVLNQQKAILKNYQSQLHEQQKAYEENGKRADQLKQKLADLAAQGVDKASAEYKKYESALKRVETEQERNEKAIQGLNEKIRAQDTAITATSNETQKWTRHLEELQGEEQDTARTTQQLDAATEKLNGGFTILKGAVASLAADAFRKLGSTMKDAVTEGAKYADEINTLSQQTSISTETLQKYNYMSGMVDVDVNTIAKSMQKLTKSMSSAKDGTGATAEAFSTLGVNVTDANGNLRDNEEVFDDVIAALGSMKNETERDAIGMQLLGKSATALNPLIEAGADQINAWAKEAEDAGYIMSDDMIKGLVKVQDEFDRFDNTVQIVKNSVAAGLAPALERGTRRLNDMVRSNDWQKVGRELGNLFSGLIDGLEWILENGGLVKGTIVGIIAAFAAQKIASIVSGIGNITKALTAMNAAANANPYVLLASVLVGLIAGMVSWSKSLGDAYWAETDLGKETERLNQLFDETHEKTEALVSAYEAMDTARSAAITSAEAEASRLQELTAELGTLVGKNGEVAEADKTRASFILNELNKALGTEYTLNDLIRGSYDAITASVGKMIEAKRAEAILAAQEEGYAQAISGRADAEATLAMTTQTLIELEDQKAAKVAERSQIEDEDFWKMTSNAQGRIEAINKEIAAIDEATAKFQSDYAAQAETVNKYTYDIAQYEANWAAVHDKQYDAINTKSYEVATAMGENVKNYAATISTNVRNASNEWLGNLSKMITETTGKNIEFKDAGKGMVQMWVDGQKEGEALPAEQVKGMAQKMMFEAQHLAQMMGESGKNAVLGLTNGVTMNQFLATQSGANLAAEFLAGFRNKMDEGSPSKEMMRSGLNAILGFVNEIYRDEGKAETAGDALANSFLTGFRDGIDGGLGADGIAGTVSAMRGNGQIYGSVSGARIVNNNLTQNNYSPKALTRREIRRDARNLLQLAGGLNNGI